MKLALSSIFDKVYPKLLADTETKQDLRDRVRK